MIRRVARRDRNHADIVATLRAVGCLVWDLAAEGHGCPDLLVWAPKKRGLVLVEVKNGELPPSARKLTPQEQAFFDTWGAAGAPVYVVNTTDEALEVVGVRVAQEVER